MRELSSLRVRLEANSKIDIQVVVLLVEALNVWIDSTVYETTALITKPEPGTLPEAEVRTDVPGRVAGSVIDPGVVVTTAHAPPIGEDAIVVKAYGVGLEVSRGVSQERVHELIVGLARVDVPDLKLLNSGLEEDLIGRSDGEDCLIDIVVELIQVDTSVDRETFADGYPTEQSLSRVVEVGPQSQRCVGPDVSLNGGTSANDVSFIEGRDIVEAVGANVGLGAPVLVPVVVRSGEDVLSAG